MKPAPAPRNEAVGFTRVLAGGGRTWCSVRPRIASYEGQEQHAMTYPSGGGPGQFPGQGPQQPQQPPGYGMPPQQGNPLAGVSLPALLALGVTLLGVVAYFCGFSDEASGADSQIILLLIAGLLAAFRAVPDGPKFLPVAAVLSVAGGLWELDAVI